MKLLSTIPLLCACALSPAQTTSSATAAPAIDPEKAALIRQVIESADSEELRSTVLTVRVRRYLALMRQNPNYPPGYVDELGRKITDRVATIDMVQLLTPIYASHFSLDELKQILTFRTSPVGRRLQAVQPEMMSEVAKQATEWAQQVSPELSNEVFADHPEYKKQIEDNKQRLGSSASGDPLAGNGSVDPAPYRIGGDVSAPSLTDKTEPRYTPEALKAKLEGSVTLAIIIDQKGVPRNIQVIRSLGMGLDEKAMEAVGQWRFKPGMKSGVPVAVRANVEVNFRLLKKAPQ